MSIFSRLFGKKEEQAEPEELTELPEEAQAGDHTRVMVDKIEMLGDADRIVKKVRSGNVVIANIRHLKENNVDELKQAISKIRNSCTMFNGDIAGVGDEWVLVTPSTARIDRGVTP